MKAIMTALLMLAATACGAVAMRTRRRFTIQQAALI
jgi:hypothetical protein